MKNQTPLQRANRKYRTSIIRLLEAQSKNRELQTENVRLWRLIDLFSAPSASGGSEGDRNKAREAIAQYFNTRGAN